MLTSFLSLLFFVSVIRFSATENIRFVSGGYLNVTSLLIRELNNDSLNYNAGSTHQDFSAMQNLKPDHLVIPLNEDMLLSILSLFTPRLVSHGYKIEIQTENNFEIIPIQGDDLIFFCYLLFHV